MHVPDSATVRRPLANTWRSLPLAIFLTAYFLWFNWGSLRVRFALDDLANLRHYFEIPAAQLILSNFLPWRGDYRPLGALFYLPIYRFAGLNPVPYQAALLAVLLLNVYFAYRLMRLLGAGELSAALVALICCYHGGVANLYYNAAFVYDAMCCCLYLAALTFYVGIRGRDRLPGVGQTLVFLALLLAALNAKEMAVSIPVMLLVYEWVYHAPAKKDRQSLVGWVRGPARTIWFAAALVLLDVYPKVAGPAAMTAAEGYRPVFSLERVRTFQVALLQDLFFSWSWKPGWAFIVGLYAVMAYIAWRHASRPVLRFLFCYLLVAPLPIEFLPGRREACFALLMFGGAAFASVVLVDGIETAVRFVAGVFKLPVRRGVLVGVMVAAVAFLWVREQRDLRRSIGGDPMTTLGWESWDIVEQMRASSFHPRPGSSVAFLDDPFGTLDMYTLARLWFHDRSVNIRGVNRVPITQEELARMDYVFKFEGRKLIRIR